MTKFNFKTAILSFALCVLGIGIVNAEYEYSTPGGQIYGFTPYIESVGATGELFVGSTLYIRNATIANGEGGTYVFKDLDGDEAVADPIVEWLAVPKDDTTDANAKYVATGLEYTIPAEFITNYPNHKLGFRIYAKTKTGLVNTSVPLFVHSVIYLAGQKVNPDDASVQPELDPTTLTPNPGVISDPPFDGVPKMDMAPVAILYELEDFQTNGINAKPVSSFDADTKVQKSYVARIIQSKAGIRSDVTSEFVNSSKPILWRMTDDKGVEIQNAIVQERISSYTGESGFNNIYTTQTTNADASAAVKSGWVEQSEQGLRLQAGFTPPPEQ